MLSLQYARTSSTVGGTKLWFFCGFPVKQQLLSSISLVLFCLVTLGLVRLGLVRLGLVRLGSDSIMEPFWIHDGYKVESAEYFPLFSSFNRAFSSRYTVSWYLSFWSVLLILQSVMTTTPLSKGIINPFAASKRISSSLHPAARAIFRGDATNPSSSPCIPKWKYRACVLVGISINLSVSTTCRENILF